MIPTDHADTLAETAAHARTCAARAAFEARVDIREITLPRELDGVVDLFAEIWRPTRYPLIGSEVMRALAKAGNYVAACYGEAGLAGACVGFFAAPSRNTLHSHVAGVRSEPGARNRGYALKLHQRAWALQRGTPAIEWTFDPLVARNAYFNLVKLGARPVEYLPDFYGAMGDGINAGGETDRLLLRWDLAAPEVVAACAGVPRTGALDIRPSETLAALRRDEHGRPVAGPADAATVLVAVPYDVQGLRSRDPRQAADWRAMVREILGGLLADGARVTGFDRDHGYVVQR